VISWHQCLTEFSYICAEQIGKRRTGTCSLLPNSSDKDDFSTSRTYKMVSGQERSADEEKIAVAASGSVSYSGIKSWELVGKTIDSKYEVISFLGEGGMGAVYRAKHLQLDKEVALKALLNDLISADSWTRFQREVQAISKLSHANIVQVFDFGTGEQNFPYYTMELLVGESLSDRLNREGRIPIADALAIFVTIAGGLPHAHRQGIVHRDIKPRNIFLENRKLGEVPRVVDFGLAKLAEAHNREQQSLTVQGIVFGSPLYMSPEQTTGLGTDHRTDIYSFGCTIFHALTGTPPFAGKTAMALMLMHQKDAPPHLAQATGGEVEFSLEQEAIVAKLLAKNVDKRYQSFEEVERDLHRALNVALSHSIAPTSPAGASLARSQARMTPPVIAPEVEKSSPKVSKEFGRLAAIFTAILLLLGIGAYFAFQFMGPQSSVHHDAKAPDMPITVPKYFSEIDSSGGRMFDFPQDKKVIGQIEWQDNKAYPASGKIFVPSGAHIHFYVGEPFFYHPEYFDEFRANDLEGLTLKAGIKWRPEHYRKIGRLTGLKGFDCGRTHTDAACLAEIRSLTNLTELRLSLDDVSGADLNKLSYLEQLDAFDGGELSEVNVVFDRFVASKKMQNMSLKDCGLVDKDMEKIAQLDNLAILSIDFNPVTLIGLRSLSRLPKLQSLRVSGIVLRPEAIDVLAKFKRLKHLRIQVSGWPQADIDRLDEAIPHCQVEKYGEGGVGGADVVPMH